VVGDQRQLGDRTVMAMQREEEKAQVVDRLDAGPCHGDLLEHALTLPAPAEGHRASGENAPGAPADLEAVLLKMHCALRGCSYVFPLRRSTSIACAVT
jgi:hypothetical protein